MISKFDKNSIRERFKKQFAECEENCDYEGALDYLLKYSDECENPSFHLACGTLYLQMTQDSDDTELYNMAYREFMMHIRRFPDCTAAYRNVIAVLFLRNDFEGALSMCALVKRRGLDLKGILTELAEVGLLFISADAPANIDDLLKPGDYGDIDSLPAEPRERSFDYRELVDDENAEVKDYMTHRPCANTTELTDRLNGKPVAEVVSKILKFSGDYVGSAPADAPQAQKTFKKNKNKLAFEPNDGFVIDDSRTLRDLDTSDYDYVDEEYDDEFGDEYEEYDDGFAEETGNIIDGFHRVLIDQIANDMPDDYRDGDYGEGEASDARATDDIDIEAFTVNKTTVRGGDESDRAVRAAMIFYDAKRYDRALAELEKIDKDSPQYYFALTVRALIEVDTGHDAQAEATLKKAVSINPERALANIILCEFYEKHGRFEEIPQLLKQTDVKDYLNSEYVYKAFRLARNYCSPEDAASLIASYIEEYNIFAIRIIYAQMLYNTGAKQRATSELYTLSRVFYDDFNASYFYLLARMGVDRMPVEDEAPQSVIAALVENMLGIARDGKLDKDDTADELFGYALEFFVTLEYENDAKLLKEMFGALRFFTDHELTAEKMTDTLVAPYAENIVKATILAEQLAKDPSRKFLADDAFRPISDETVFVPQGCSRGFYRALAFAAFFLDKGLERLKRFADEASSQGIDGLDEYEEAYCLLRRTAESLGEKLDGRIALAVGCPSLTAANRAYAKFASYK